MNEFELIAAMLSDLGRRVSQVEINSGLGLSDGMVRIANASERWTPQGSKMLLTVSDTDFLSAVVNVPRSMPAIR